MLGARECHEESLTTPLKKALQPTARGGCKLRLVLPLEVIFFVRFGFVQIVRRPGSVIRPPMMGVYDA